MARALLSRYGMTFEDDPTREYVRLAERTLELPPISRPLSIPAFATDIVARRREPRQPLVLAAGAVLLACCLVTGTLGIAVGRASASSPALLASARVPRVAVVLAAHEAITEEPLTAPAKLVVALPSQLAAPRALRQPARTPAPAPTPPPPVPARRPGFQRPSNLPPKG